MKTPYLILGGILVLAALAIFLTLRLSSPGKRSENLWRLAILCVGFSAVFTLISAIKSGNPKDYLKLSGPGTVMVIALAVRRRRKT